MEVQILEELHSMNQKMDVGFGSINQRLDGFSLRFEQADERFYKLKGRVDDYMSLTVKNTMDIFGLKEAISEINASRGIDQEIPME